jgi:hypothetical protein
MLVIWGIADPIAYGATDTEEEENSIEKERRNTRMHAVQLYSGGRRSS